MNTRIAIIGPGRVGQSIGRVLRSRGYPIGAVIGRTQADSRAAAAFIGAEMMATTNLERCCGSGIIFVTVPDDALAGVVAALAHVHLPAETLLIHCSGLHTTEVFGALKPAEHKLQTLALHPLQTFAAPDAGAAALPGSYCSLQGDAVALERGRELAEALGCRSFVINAEDKVVYHAAACMVSNYIATLVDAACDLCGDIAPESQVFPQAFAPLVQAAVSNTLKDGAQKALTGPIARGDAGTIDAHVHSIATKHPELLCMYLTLARKTMDLACKGNSLDDAQVEALQQVLKRY